MLLLDEAAAVGSLGGTWRPVLARLGGFGIDLLSRKVLPEFRSSRRATLVLAAAFAHAAGIFAAGVSCRAGAAGAGGGAAVASRGALRSSLADPGGGSWRGRAS